MLNARFFQHAAGRRGFCTAIIQLEEIDRRIKAFEDQAAQVDLSTPEQEYITRPEQKCITSAGLERH